MLTAVDTISLNIEEGEITGLAGESGCGKSLSALSIPRLLPREAEITGGEILFQGDKNKAPLNMAALDEKELCRIRGKDISMIFQEPRLSLNPLQRIGTQIAEVLTVHGLSGKKESRAAALEMLNKLGLNKSQNIFEAYPHQLSGGMCQRVMIAIAAICRPKLLIADEPTTALDEKIQNQILELLAGINGETGAAVLFISHDLSLVRRFCRRFLVMYAGKIVEGGNAGDIFTHAVHPYTRGLIGAIPGKEQRGKALANIPGKVPSIEDRLPGCPFAPRCPLAQEKCREAFPPKTDLGNGRFVHCFFAEEHPHE